MACLLPPPLPLFACLVLTTPTCLPSPLQPASLETCCMTSFPEANRSLRRTPGVDVTLSGSTAVVALLSGGRLQVANLGDSRAVLGE